MQATGPSARTSFSDPPGGSPNAPWTPTAVPRQGDPLEAQLEDLLARLDPFLGLARELDPTAFRELAPTPHSGTLVAVDGSHRILLDGRSFHVLALRAGRIHLRAGHQQELHSPLQLRLVGQEDLLATYQEAYRSLSGPLGLPDLPPPHFALAAAAERLRELAEWQAALEALLELGAGDLLLLDGSLHTPSRHGRLVLDHLQALAGERGVALMGISKRSALSLHGLPLLPALERFGRGRGLSPGWAYPLHRLVPVRSAGEVWAYGFGPEGPAFRVDLARGLDPLKALSILAHYCDDLLYPGYPYPLAQVHNLVYLGAQEGRDLVQRLQSRSLHRGLPPGAWQVLFADYHEVLDRSV